ncbi:P-loop containing nucleoside triphosphate hydrolase protein [Amylocarpus encephaloides]|uniref:Gluconokinase n=1 Tax=Amylocarpus encephaloides TaxID=45428 RepID=A0A9P7YLA3_9HELO|nr:P-loop containing nucleoside triphosphate hydrolase protein [Amylocarpus encephaloides]
MLSYDNRPAMGQPSQTSAQTPTPTPIPIPIPIPTTSNHLPVASSATVPSTNMSRTNDQPPPTGHQHIFLITGPAGCGKSSIAAFIAESMNLPYIEGDEFHPQSNVEKMSRGIPLTDADRWDWLIALREEALRKISSGSQGVVVTCSALKRKYRDVIRVAPYYSHDLLVHFVYLHATEDVLVARVGARQNHYMSASMVHSQFGILEAPSSEETDVITVDVSGSLEEVEQDALQKIQLAIGQI